MRKITFLISFISLYSFVCAGVTGKVSGRITNADSGEPLIGANVILKGTVLGAASDLDGYFNILNVRPGYYDLQVNMIGFAEKSVTNVRVEIDLTAFINKLVAFSTLRGPEVTRKISTLSFFAVLFSKAKCVSTNFGSMLCFSQKNFL